jgi:hypothetical protein
VTSGTRPSLPGSVQELTPEWFSSALGEVVVDVDLEQLDVGVGFLGQTVRARLFGATPADTRVLIVKLAAEGPARAVATSMGLYEREVRFYRDLAAGVGIPVPDCSLAEIDLDRGVFVLLLQDLSPARAGDQLAGATDDEIAAAVSTAAQLHAAWWDNPALERHPWLPSQATLVAATLERAPALYPAFAEAWSGHFSHDELALGERVTLGLGRVMAAVDHPPFTLVHGDYRLDNLFFAPDGSVVVIDWQLPFRGHSGAFDLALLLASSLTSEDRNRLMRQMETLYLEELTHRGVAGFDPDGLRQSLAAAAGQLLVRCPIAHQIPSPNDRAVEMRARLFRGYWDIALHAGLDDLL